VESTPKATLFFPSDSDASISRTDRTEWRVWCCLGSLFGFVWCVRVLLGPGFQQHALPELPLLQWLANHSSIGRGWDSIPGRGHLHLQQFWLSMECSSGKLEAHGFETMASAWQVRGKCGKLKTSRIDWNRLEKVERCSVVTKLIQIVLSLEHVGNMLATCFDIAHLLTLCSVRYVDISPTIVNSFSERGHLSELRSYLDRSFRLAICFGHLWIGHEISGYNCQCPIGKSDIAAGGGVPWLGRVKQNPNY
jgi:hypothetical protein